MDIITSARDNPGTLREYETILILRPDTLQEGILSLNKTLKEIIDEQGGRLLLIENWGKRRLAYEIRKQLKGIYMYYQFLGHADLVKEMERRTRMTESVIRYFNVRIDANIDPNARPGQVSEEDFLAASATQPDEEELATGYVMTGTGEKIPVDNLRYGGEEGDEDEEEESTMSHDGDDSDDHFWGDRVVDASPPAAVSPGEEAPRDDVTPGGQEAKAEQPEEDKEG